MKACDRALSQILPYTEGIGVIIGTVMAGSYDHLLYNSAILIEDGIIAVSYTHLDVYKRQDPTRHCALLPNGS